MITKETGGGLQHVDYNYNVRGWLKAINDPDNLGADLFAFDINYNTADHSGSPLYNGNIAETEWKTANDNTLRWYRYGYDALNRIENAIGNTTNYNLVNVDYDKMGNITALERRGHTNSGATSFGVMDNLIYTYNGGNKLTKVLDNGNDRYGFADGADSTTEYTYDANGNMITDDNKGITAIAYNHLNLPTSVTMGGGTISYIYDAAGTKLKKTAGSSVTEYAGNYVYSGTTSSTALQFFNHPEGYVYKDGSAYKYVYQYKDHLGNIRLSYEDGNNNGSMDQSEIVEENNYYPFGLKHKGYNSGTSSLGNSVANRWKFGGKELDDSFNDELATYDFGARNYSPDLGRWMNLDPLAEEYYSLSPYNYVANSPLVFIDPTGMWIQQVNEDGSITYIAEEGDSAWSFFEQYGEAEGFTADQANQVIQDIFGKNRVVDGKEFSNVKPEDEFTFFNEAEPEESSTDVVATEETVQDVEPLVDPNAYREWYEDFSGEANAQLDALAIYRSYDDESEGYWAYIWEQVRLTHIDIASGRSGSGSSRGRTGGVGAARRGRSAGKKPTKAAVKKQTVTVSGQVKTVQTGSQGGKYYINKNGNKTYLNRDGTKRQ